MANNDLGYIPVRIGQIAHDQAWWNNNKNLILLKGELGINTTDDIIYIGDGLSTWEHCKKITIGVESGASGTEVYINGIKQNTWNADTYINNAVKAVSGTDVCIGGQVQGTWNADTYINNAINKAIGEAIGGSY